MLYIDDKTAYNDYKEYLSTSPEHIVVKGNIITTEDYTVEVKDEYSDLIKYVREIIGETRFDTSGYKTEIVENQGYKFVTFKG